MSEVIEQELVEQVKDKQQIGFNPFDEKTWSQSSIEQKVQEFKEKTTDQLLEVKTEAVKEKTEIDYNSFIKNEFGFETLDEAKDFIKSAKEKKEQPELKFENTESEKIFNLLREGKKEDVYNFLSEQNKIEKLTSLEVNEKTAEQILKLSIKKDYPTLSDDEIDFSFDEKYALPEKPEQGFDETDEDYLKSVESWQKRVDAINKKMVIEAKMAQPKIAELKSNLVLPNIETSTNQFEPTQEDLQKAQEVRKMFEESLESEYKNFGGFNVTFKDESSQIEIPISFTPTDEEKLSLKNELSDFDHTDYFGNRWFTNEGKPQITKMMEDKFFLENKEKILQKVANEAANKMRLKMIEMQGNVKLNETASNLTSQSQQQLTVNDLASWAWKNS